jgi:hypothetical protein
MFSERRWVMQGLEALYTVEFDDFTGPGFRNGGVVVLETNRIFGGDSGYYYIGTFSAKEGKLDGSARITKHNPAWMNAFGDASSEFDIRIAAIIKPDLIEGFMERCERPGMRLALRLIRKASLP